MLTSQEIERIDTTLKIAMRAFYTIILILIISTCTWGQGPKLFVVKETLIKDSSAIKKVDDFVRNDSCFFQDNLYVVRKTCKGEWGGSVWFYNKKTGNEYSCAATCPVVINKVDGKYILTCTLAHLDGSSAIIEIAKPDSMDIFKLPEPRAKKRKIEYRFVGDNESKATKGTRQLLDSIGILTLASFPYDGKLYHIVTDFHKTFVTKIEDKKFATIDTISDESLWTYDPEVIKTKDNHMIVFFTNEKANGYIDLFNNEINVIRYK